jgi:predicted glycosyltransferase
VNGAGRVLFYSHNGVGVGHVQRHLKLAAAYAGSHPDTAVLLVTGSHAAGSLDWPPGLDYVKLPSIRMVDRYENWEPREVGVPIKRLMRLRADLIKQAVRRFRPQLLVADFLPAGPYGELLPALEELGAQGGRAVAGFRDIIDEPGFVRGLWDRTGVHDVIRDHYSGVCVYGAREVVDFERAYGLEAPEPSGLFYAGFLTRRSLEAPVADRPLVICTTGGGVDGGPLIAAFIEAAREVRRELGGRWVALTGPLIADEEHERLALAADGGDGAEVIRSVDDLQGLLAAADGVVAMAGYNTACELLAARVPALIVPRGGPSMEQRLRAAQLERWGAARVLEPEDANASAIAAGIRVLLGAARPEPARVELGGLARAAGFFDVVAAGTAIEAR